MPRETIADLITFVAVARERSFTRAAAQLDISPSALSHTIRKLEERLGVRLLTRTTRSVSPTEAGERLLRSVGPHFDEIRAGLEELSELRDKPAGTIRITTGDHAAEKIILPAVIRLLRDYPDINVEIDVNPGFVDIGSPAYFADRELLRNPHDLASHECINLRFPTRGAVYVWEFEKSGRPLNVRVNGQLVVNDIALMRQAALGGLGLDYLPEDYFEPHLANGNLVRVLDDWCPPFPGYHLYYPSRRQQSPAFALLIDALRYRGP